MRFKISTVFQFTARWLNKYHENSKVKKNIYRIIHVNHFSSNQYKLKIQELGKTTYVECTPQEIIANDQYIAGFSLKDIHTILSLCVAQIKKPQYKIIMQDCCDKFNRMVFKLKETRTGSLVVKTASQILLDKNIVNNLSAEDLNSISFVAGYEHSQQMMSAVTLKSPQD